MKKKLIIIGANDFQNELVLKAKELNYETHVFAWEDGAVAKENADYFYPISITDKENILKAAKKIKPIGVVSIASDLAVPTVNYVASKLGLISNSNFCTRVSTNKFEMRKVLEENSLPVPKYKLIQDYDELDRQNMKLPFIVKPVDRSGSRGITRIDDLDNLEQAVNKALEVSFTDKVLVEEYAQGKEFSVESISYNGEHSVLQITEKFTTGAPNFVETMHIQPAPINKQLRNKIIEVVHKSLDALDIRYGASHTELKVYGNEIKIIEIGSRMGGDCIGSDLVQISTGNDFTKMVIEAAVGINPKVSEENTKAIAAVKFIFDADDIKVLENIKRQNKSNIYRISEIDLSGIQKKYIDNSASRCGYFITEFTSYEECCSMLKVSTICK